MGMADSRRLGNLDVDQEMTKLTAYYLCVFASCAGALLFMGQAKQVREFRATEAIMDRQDVPDSLIEWADRHHIDRITLEYGLDTFEYKNRQPNKITVLMLDGEGHCMVDTQDEKRQ